MKQQLIVNTECQKIYKNERGKSIMRSIGIVRKLDNLGRIVIPKELRNKMDIEEGTGLEIYTEGNKIILQKYEQKCVFCGEDNLNIIEDHGDKKICHKCIKEIGQMKKL